jgi:hypothetical protein
MAANSNHRKELKRNITPHTFEVFNSTASGITGVIDTMKIKIKKVEAEIKIDEGDRLDFKKHFTQLSTKRAELEAKLAENDEWTKGCAAITTNFCEHHRHAGCQSPPTPTPYL